MEPDLLLAVANHLANKATLPSYTYYVTLANNGTEVSGVTRQLVTYDDPVVVSPTEITWSNATAVSIDPPNGTADEAWVMSAPSGGLRLFRCPFDAPITLTSGITKTFAPGDLTHTIDNTTPAAP